MEHRQKYGVILLLGLLMLAVVAIACIVQSRGEALLRQVTIRIPDYGQPLRPIVDESDGTYDLYLPAYASQEQLQIMAPWGVKVSVSDGVFHYDSLAEVPLRTELQLSLQTWFWTESYSIQLWQNTNLPTLYIEAENGTIEFLSEDVNRRKEVMVNMIDTQGERILCQTADISGRGNGSWHNAKRPYNLKFSVPVTVGPFEDIEKLCLFSEFDDGSKFRNSVAYYTAQELNHTYTSGYQHINLYVNGEYLGLYGITTKQEYEKHIQSDGILAVFEHTAQEKENQFCTFPALQWFRVIYGDFDWVKDYLDVFTYELQQQNWDACEQMMDMESIARKMVLEEFIGNYDMNFGSQYYYIDENHVIHAMLPWDYEWTFGNEIIYYNNASEYQITAYCEEFWYAQLLEYEPFRQMAVRELETYYTDGFLASLDDFVAKTTEQIAQSRDCDAQRWKNAYSRNYWESRAGEDTLLATAERFFSYFPARRDFLLAYYKAPEDYFRVEFLHFVNSNIMVEKGKLLQPYLTSDFLNASDYFGEIYLRWDADGMTPYDVKEVDRDYSFSLLRDENIPLETETTREVLPDRGKQAAVIICGTFGLTAMLLLGTELLRHHIKRKKKDEVAV